MKVHYLSQSNEWETPQQLFDDLNAEFKFTLDPCATVENAKCKRFYTIADDGLKQDWSGETVFMNPPYGREIALWMKKAYNEWKKGAVIVCLIPARTDTKWWHNYAMKGKIRFIKGRLKFINRTLSNHKDGGDFKKTSAPFPSAIVIFNHIQQGENNGVQEISAYCTIKYS